MRPGDAVGPETWTDLYAHACMTCFQAPNLTLAQKKVPLVWWPGVICLPREGVGRRAGIQAGLETLLFWVRTPEDFQRWG